MRYILISLLFLGCSFIPETQWLPPQGIDTNEKMQSLVLSIDKVESVGPGSWNTPKETHDTLEGDCNDISGVIAAIMIYNLGYSDVELVGCISRKSLSPHMLVYADGKYYESFNGRELSSFDKKYIITNTMSYETYLLLAKIL